MKKGCALASLLWLALVGAYAGVAWWRIQEVFPAVVIGILGGTFAGVFVSGVTGFVQGLKQRSAIRRSQRGEPRVDGRLEAASGPIRPLADALEAPFSGKPCVAYDYDVKNTAAGRSDFAGVALAPCAIDSPAGPVKLLGWMDLDGFGTGPKTFDLERVAAYLHRTTFEPLGLTTVVSTVGSLISDDDGAIRKDFRIESSKVDLEGKTIVERIVPVGQPVTALGIWSAAGGGFDPKGKAVNRLLPIGADWAAEEVVSDARKKLAITFGFFFALHALLVPMYLLSPGRPKKDRAGKVIPKNPSVWDERDCDRLRDLLAAGADPNQKAIAGRTPLMNAVSNGQIECVKSLVAAGGLPDAADEDGSSAMSWAITAEREDLVAVLKSGGGTDFRVTRETGSPLGPTDEPVRAVLAYDAALQAGDLDGLSRVSKPSTPAFIKKQGVLRLWQHTRPNSPEFVSGFGNEKAATLTVRGQTVSSKERVIDFHYHVVKNADGWHVEKEWFKD